MYLTGYIIEKGRHKETGISLFSKTNPEIRITAPKHFQRTSNIIVYD